MRKPKPTRTEREMDQDQKLARYIICTFYTGPLPSGVVCPGYIESTKNDRRPAAYVVPISEYENRNVQRTVDRIQPGLNTFAEAKWVTEHVRLIKISDTHGLSREEIMRDYLVRVPYPLSSASTAELIRRPGRAASQIAVPDGKTQADMARETLANRSISRDKRMNEALARYSKPGVPYDPSTEQFPGPGDHWK